MSQRAIRYALSYLCTKHDTVLAGITESGALTNELLTSEAVAELSDALEWGRKLDTKQARKEAKRRLK